MTGKYLDEAPILLNGSTWQQEIRDMFEKGEVTEKKIRAIVERAIAEQTTTHPA